MDARIEEWIARLESCGDDKEKTRVTMKEISHEAREAGLLNALGEALRRQADHAALMYGVAQADVAMRFGPLPDEE